MILLWLYFANFKGHETTLSARAKASKPKFKWQPRSSRFHSGFHRVRSLCVWPWCSFLLLVQILYIWLFTRLKYMFICLAHAHGCSASCKLSFVPLLPLTPVEILHSTFECCETFISNASFHHNRLLFYNIYLEQAVLLENLWQRSFIVCFLSLSFSVPTVHT